MVFTIYGHGGHLEFQIMTHFSLILYIYHICAKYEISLKLDSYFHRKCHLIFFLYGCHSNQSCHAIFGGWSGGAMVLGKLPVPGRPTIWITVGQGPTALAVGAGGGCLDIFTLIYPFSPLSPSLWETARYRLKHCLKRPLNLKQPTNQSCNFHKIFIYVIRTLS